MSRLYHLGLEHPDKLRHRRGSAIWVDHLTFNPSGQRLEGHTTYRGEPRERDLWAERVENLQPGSGGKTS